MNSSYLLWEFYELITYKELSTILDIEQALNTTFTNKRRCWLAVSYAEQTGNKTIQSATGFNSVEVPSVFRAFRGSRQQEVARDWNRSVFIPAPKKGNARKCSNILCTIALISYASKVMLKILQAKFQQYLDQELSDEQAGFRKGRGTEDQIANICWIM